MAKDKALLRAIKIVGGESKLARCLGISRQAVNKWESAPPVYAWAIDGLTEGKVTCHQLRPDIFPPLEDMMRAKL